MADQRAWVAESAPIACSSRHSHLRAWRVHKNLVCQRGSSSVEGHADDPSNAERRFKDRGKSACVADSKNGGRPRLAAWNRERGESREGNHWTWAEISVEPVSSPAYSLCCFDGWMLPDYEEGPLRDCVRALFWSVASSSNQTRSASSHGHSGTAAQHRRTTS